MAKRKVNRQRSPLPEVQTPYQILKAVQSGIVTEKELRQQYTALRDRAQKQLKRLVASKYGVPERWAMEAGKGEFWKLSDIKSLRELAYSMSNIQEFIAAKDTSVSAMRERVSKALDKLHSHGYTGITRRNMKQFGRFMEAMRQRMGGRKSYPSGDLAQFFSDQKEQGVRLPVRPDRLEAAFFKWLEENPD